MRRGLLNGTLVLLAILLWFPSVVAAEHVEFKPFRAPSIGPEDAPVTVIEIADFM